MSKTVSNQSEEREEENGCIMFCPLISPVCDCAVVQEFAPAAAARAV